MIYLDHAATGYPKSPLVRSAVQEALVHYGANPGRGGYEAAMRTSEQLYRCREVMADTFGVSDPLRVIFTLNCTAALNMAIHSLFCDGGRAVVSDLEHNAVMRPLYAYIPHGIDIAHVTPYDTEATVDAFRRAVTPQTKAIVCSHASNVIGCALPAKELAALAHRHGLPLVLDAAQSAGHLPLSAKEDGADIVCLAGHKGIGGPMGTGALLCRRPIPLEPLVFGGTGSASASAEMPEQFPERMESGTPNVAGICGLRAAVSALGADGVARDARRQLCLCTQFYDHLATVPHVHLISPRPQAGRSTPVVSLTVDGISPTEVCDALARFGIAARGGLHCAPLAHRTLGTFPEGTVRISVGVGNTTKQLQYCTEILKKIAENPLCFRSGYGKI